MFYYDAHTHFETRDVATFAIKNNIIGDEPVIDKTYFYSSGIHPWYIYNAKDQFIDLEQFATFKNCVAIGEIGLDKVCETNFDTQLQVFENCLAIAQKYKKTIVIHCVKAQNEILQILKKCQFTQPVLIHGFNQNKAVLEKWLNANCYISFGAALLKENSNASKLLKDIPLHKLLLETDNAPITIQEIYELAALNLFISAEKLKIILEENFKNFYSL